jgi:guanine nucleotide-binding protein G(o) subunit alpha
MGLCASSENLSAEEQQRRKAEKERSKALESSLTQDHSSDQAINKLLLLGAGESGKSTLFKQMIQIYGKGYPESERKTFIPIIYNNIITTMKTLCAQSATYAPIQDPQLLGIKNYIENELKGDEDIEENLAANIQALWLSPEIQETYKNRAHYHLTDSAAYFNDRIIEVGADNYLPTEQDVLRSRVRTTGIVENEFEIDGNQFKMFDVGGQRNERKKWIHCFENVTAVLFVAAISEYDQMLYEDENTNRIVEALNLFEEICNSRWFRETSMILFLNKRDLFADKIQAVPLELYFPEYKGGGDVDSARAFMQEQFESKNRNPDKQIYTHVTCATDTHNIAAVFNAVKDIIIRKSLNEAGLV